MFRRFVMLALPLITLQVIDATLVSASLGACTCWECSHQPTKCVAPSATACDTKAPNTKDATIRVRVPADAKVFVSGKQTESTGTYRVFRVPNLKTDAVATYNVQATRTGDGRKTHVEVAKVRGGEFCEITFSRLDFKLP